MHSSILEIVLLKAGGLPCFVKCGEGFASDLANQVAGQEVLCFSFLVSKHCTLRFGFGPVRLPRLG